MAEALTTAVKHAGAAQVDVAVAHRDGVLHVRVGDDGRGGADPTGDSGLVGLTDRVEAVGGRLELHGPHGAGTTLSSRLAVEDPGPL